MAWSAAISWIVLRPLIASMATLALNSGLWVRRFLNSCGEGCAYGGSPFQGRCPASEVNDGGCPEKPDHLKGDGRQFLDRPTESAAAKQLLELIGGSIGDGQGIAN
jgi:hypothetical protein